MAQRKSKKSRYKPTWKQPITLTLPPALLAQIEARGDNRSEVVRQDLEDYYVLLAHQA